MSEYPFLITSDYTVRFKHFPAHEFRFNSKTAAKEKAKDVLIQLMQEYFDRRVLIPVPELIESTHSCYEIIVLEQWRVAKILLFNVISGMSDGHRPIDLAKRWGVLAQSATRYLDLKHPTKIDTLEKLIARLGRQLRITVIDQ